MADAVGDEAEERQEVEPSDRKWDEAAAAGGGSGTYEVKPSTHRFFQMFLLWKSSGKDRWGREEGAGSESSSAGNTRVKSSDNILTERETF